MRLGRFCASVAGLATSLAAGFAYIGTVESVFCFYHIGREGSEKVVRVPFPPGIVRKGFIFLGLIKVCSICLRLARD